MSDRQTAIAAVRIPVNNDVYLGHFSQADVPAVYKLTDAAIVDAGMNERWPYTMEQAQDLVNHMSSGHDDPSVPLDQLKTFCIRDAKTDEPAGVLGIYVPPVDANGDQPPTQIGYLLFPAYRGRGNVTAAISVLLRIAFTQLQPNIQLLTAKSFTFNTASHRVLERLHFKLNKVLKGVVTKTLSDGAMHTLDEKEYMLTKVDWLQHNSDKEA